MAEDNDGAGEFSNSYNAAGDVTSVTKTYPNGPTRTTTYGLDALHRNRLTVFGVSNRFRVAAQRAETVRGFVRDVLPYFEDGRIRPLVDKTFAFEELPAAIKFMESDAQVGKLVVLI